MRTFLLGKISLCQLHVLVNFAQISKFYNPVPFLMKNILPKRSIFKTENQTWYNSILNYNQKYHVSLTYTETNYIYKYRLWHSEILPDPQFSHQNTAGSLAIKHTVRDNIETKVKISREKYKIVYAARKWWYVEIMVWYESLCTSFEARPNWECLVHYFS